MIFNYRAIDKKGVVIEGKVESITQKEAQNKLGKLGLNVVEMKAPSEFSLWMKSLERALGISQLGLDRKGQIEFYKEVQSLLKVGLSPMEAITYMSSPNTDSLKQKLAAQSVLQKMQEGNHFSQAMKVAGFPSAACESLWVGEATGSLQKAIFAVIRQEELAKKLGEGMLGIYLGPFLIGAAMIAAFIASIIYMVPIQMKVIDNLVSGPEEYPMMSASVAWLGEWGILLTGTVVGTVFTILFLLKVVLNYSESFRYKWDVFKMGFPVFGPFYLYQEYARITNLLGIALGKTKKQSIVTGMLMHQVHSPVMKNKMTRIHHLVDDKGFTLSEAMQSVDFNQLISTFIKRGEQAGMKEVSSILNDITEHFEYKSLHNLEVLKGASELSNMLILITLSIPVLLISVGPSLDQIPLMMSKVG